MESRIDELEERKHNLLSALSDVNSELEYWRGVRDHERRLEKIKSGKRVLLFEEVDEDEIEELTSEGYEAKRFQATCEFVSETLYNRWDKNKAKIYLDKIEMDEDYLETLEYGEKIVGSKARKRIKRWANGRGRWQVLDFNYGREGKIKSKLTLEALLF